MYSFDPIAEPKYKEVSGACVGRPPFSILCSKEENEPVAQSKEDLEVAEILSNIVENVSANADETTRFFTTVKENEISTVDMNISNDLPKPSSQDYPLDSNTILKHTLLDLITKVVSDHDLQKKYEFPIDSKYIDCLKQITEKHPNYFGAFESSLMSIAKDGRISVADFPEIVKMVMELYTILYSLHPKDLVDMCAGVLKTVFFIAVKEKVIVVENENEVIGAFDNFIDSIVELLKMHIQLYGSWNNITCNFRQLFGF
uniref:Uncharacterized protein n=1 Tax=viral metagenome TaxID=1070528 RepID=A0A6C0JZQ6_9ZZZZ